MGDMGELGDSRQGVHMNGMGLRRPWRGVTALLATGRAERAIQWKPSAGARHFKKIEELVSEVPKSTGPRQLLIKRFSLQADGACGQVR